MIPAIGLNVVFDLLAQYMVAMLRLGAFMIASPVFGGRFIPLPIRILATAVIALPVMANAPLPDPSTIADLRFIAVIMAELTIGIAAGLVLSILFGAASVAGDRIASTAGLGFAAQFDPAAGGQTPVVSQIFGLFLLSCFIGTEGHLTAIRLILDSYTTLPIGSSLNPTVLISAGLHAGGQMFIIASTMMLPVVSVLLILNIVIGVLTRAAPQLNVFSFGFPVTMTATMLLIYLFAPGLISSFEDLIDISLRTLAELMEALTDG
jgi:flagellar biosynthesis protein FliR